MASLRLRQPLPAAVWLVLAALAALVLPKALASRSFNVDLLWQRRLGDFVLANGAVPRRIDGTFSVPGASWIPQEWAFSTGVAIAERAHAWNVFVVMLAACGFATLAIVAYRAVVRGSEPMAVTLATAFAAIVLFMSFGVRAQVVAWLPLSLMLLLLETEGAGPWWCLPVIVLWANLHASVVLAPVVIGIAAIGAAIDDRAFSTRVRTRAIIAALSLVAICCTPLGTALYPYALALENGFVRTAIGEWQPPVLDDPRIYFGMLPLLVIVLARGFGPVRSATDLGLFMFFAISGLDAGRHVPLFAIAIAPMAASALTAPRLQRSAEMLRDLTSRRSVFTALPVALMCFGLAVFASEKILTQRYRVGETLIPPYALIARISSLPGERRVFCGDWSWCTSVLAAPNAEVFMDSRADPYPSRIWQEDERITHVAPVWRKLLDDYRVDTMLVGTESELALFASDTHEWKRIGTYGNMTLLTRKT